MGKELKCQLYCECTHCGERYCGASGKCAQHCKDCRTASGRKECDEENEEILVNMLETAGVKGTQIIDLDE